MKTLHQFFLFSLLLISSFTYAQYTDVINSNRPGNSMSAFSVGTKVLQAELGGSYEYKEHTGLLTQNYLNHLDFAVRYGFFKEQLEIVWDGQYAFDEFHDNGVSPSTSQKIKYFSRNTIGLKYLIYDPYKKERKPNLYSWRKNNVLQWHDLIPAVAVYFGGNLNLGTPNPMYPEASTFSPKGIIATQNNFGYNWVFVTNFIYDRFTEDDPIFSYILTLTHTLNNPKYSIFVEHQGIKSDAYGDGLIRIGAARLFSKNFQIDISAGTNIKDTPSRYFGGIGISYRLDRHQDALIGIRKKE
ncbi:transporter [Zhouia sp. PK063]|uniref:transporter n=1 Tax=Zhouia sp. PK063 TaxID=3373602 RepID=UPI0037B4F49F